MAEKQQLFSLQNFDDTEPYSPFPLPIPADTLQLQQDVIDVVEGRVEISSFPEDYQKKIVAYYRFTPVLHQTSKMGNAAPRTNDTLDAI